MAELRQALVLVVDGLLNATRRVTKHLVIGQQPLRIELKLMIRVFHNKCAFYVRGRTANAVLDEFLEQLELLLVQALKDAVFLAVLAQLGKACRLP